MNTLRMLLVVTLAVATSVTMAAEPIAVNVPRVATTPAPSLTRAEVLADLHMWRLSGAQEFSTSELEAQNSEGYQAALARYKALRSSPEYATLVERLQGKPFATVVGR
jgi:hypothetical protein